MNEPTKDVRAELRRVLDRAPETIRGHTQQGRSWFISFRDVLTKFLYVFTSGEGHRSFTEEERQHIRQAMNQLFRKQQKFYAKRSSSGYSSPTKAMEQELLGDLANLLPKPPDEPE